MAVATKKKTPRKVVMVRVICMVLAFLMILPMLISTLMTGVYW